MISVRFNHTYRNQLTQVYKKMATERVVCISDGYQENEGKVINNDTVTSFYRKKVRPRIPCLAHLIDIAQ